jgi:hypothetical protein
MGTQPERYHEQNHIDPIQPSRHTQPAIQGIKYHEDGRKQWESLVDKKKNGEEDKDIHIPESIPPPGSQIHISCAREDKVKKSGHQGVFFTSRAFADS